MVRRFERAELLGTVLDGRYRIRLPLGTGATAEVFEVHDGPRARRCALKVLKPLYAHHRDMAARMRREAEVSRRVRHPGVVAVWDEGTLQDGSPYLVMERVYGESVADLLGRLGSLAAPEALCITLRVAAILHDVHAAGYIHRDVKPEHVLLSASGARLHVRLLDFGVCHPSDPSPEQRERERGRVYGTPGYASPEQVAGAVDIDGRSDLFGLGAVLFEMLTGSRPFTGRNAAVVLRRTLELDAPCVRERVPHVRDEVAELAAGLLSRSVHHRPLNARAVERHIRELGVPLRGVERELGTQLTPTATAEHVATTVVGPARQALAR